MHSKTIVRWFTLHIARKGIKELKNELLNEIFTSLLQFLYCLIQTPFTFNIAVFILPHSDTLYFQYCSFYTASFPHPSLSILAYTAAFHSLHFQYCGLYCLILTLFTFNIAVLYCLIPTPFNVNISLNCCIP